MKKLFSLFFGLFVMAGVFTHGQNIPEVDFEGLEPVLNKNNDTTYVLNFWATWCKPCVEELPDFLEVEADHQDEKVRFVFVSLDFPSQMETRLKPFVEEHEMEGRVILLNDPDSNSWIEKVSSEWSGAIPATLIYRRDNRSFYEKSLSQSELRKIIKTKTL